MPDPPLQALDQHWAVTSVLKTEVFLGHRLRLINNFNFKLRAYTVCAITREREKNQSQRFIFASQVDPGIPPGQFPKVPSKGKKCLVATLWQMEIDESRCRL
jgi:hypothetical protein